MPGVGKLIKQAQKMQKKMQEMQEMLGGQEWEISSGGGAVKVKVNGAQEIKGITLDPEFLKEEKNFIEETILAAMQEALAKAKAVNEEEMSRITGGMNFPGLM